MNITTLRLRYTQLFLFALLGISLYASSQSLSGGVTEFSKSFWNRKFLISGMTALRLKIGDRVFSQAVVGKAGWLDYTADRNLDGYQNATKISPEALENLQKKIRRLYEQLKKRNMTLLIVIAPNKATIYPDKLPDEIQKLDSTSQLDALNSYLKQRGPSVLLDLRPALRNGRKKQDVYYATDTHWNTYGAFIAYTEVMKTLSKTYPQLTPKNITDFKIKNNRPYQHDIPRSMGADNLLENGFELIPKKSITVKWKILNKDNIVPMQVSTIPNKHLPSLLMYIDSFGLGIKKFIPYHFRKATFIQNTTMHADLKSLKEVDKIKPDIVIIEFVERSFTNERLYDILNDLLGEKD